MAQRKRPLQTAILMANVILLTKIPVDEMRDGDANNSLTLLSDVHWLPMMISEF